MTSQSTNAINKSASADLQVIKSQSDFINILPLANDNAISAPCALINKLLSDYDNCKKVIEDTEIEKKNPENSKKQIKRINAQIKKYITDKHECQKLIIQCVHDLLFNNISVFNDISLYNKLNNEISIVLDSRVDYTNNYEKIIDVLNLVYKMYKLNTEKKIINDVNKEWKEHYDYEGPKYNKESVYILYQIFTTIDVNFDVEYIFIYLQTQDINQLIDYEHENLKKLYEQNKTSFKNWIDEKLD